MYDRLSRKKLILLRSNIDVVYTCKPEQLVRTRLAGGRGGKSDSAYGRDGLKSRFLRPTAAMTEGPYYQTDIVGLFSPRKQLTTQKKIA